MAAGIPVLLALLGAAPGATYGPAVPAEPTAEARTAKPSCSDQTAATHPDAIIVCAPRPQGYRLNPEVMEARDDKRRQQAGRPTRPGVLADDSCKSGPRGCVSGGVNVIAVALTAAEMAARLSRGQEIGSMFVTDPQKTEYDFYVEAKKRREAEESAAAAEAKKQGTDGP